MLVSTTLLLQPAAKFGNESASNMVNVSTINLLNICNSELDNSCNLGLLTFVELTMALRV